MHLFGNPLELLILDVDGVILDVRSRLRGALERTAALLGLSIEPLAAAFDATITSPLVAGGLNKQVEALWPHLDYDGVQNFCWTLQKDRRERPWPLIPGSYETLAWFRGRKIPLALCTTNDLMTLEHQLDAVEIPLGWFSALSTRESGHPKPDPRALTMIIDPLGVSGHHTIYVGDWEPDLLAARGAGIRFIACLSGGVPYGFFTSRGVPARHIIRQLSELPALTAPR
jgi:phosphoglycolate phosphatase-like HAD superfamily hydrolase